jgi:signal peptidase I
MTSERTPTLGSSEEPGGRGESRRKKTKERSFWKELPILVVLALGLALIIKTFLIQAFYIPSESMENTLVPGDRVLVNKLAYRLGEVKRGDVIVFNGANSWEPEVLTEEPTNSAGRFVRWVGELFGFSAVGEKDFIKRVIGLPGDKVGLDKSGRLTVNGRALNEAEYIYPGDAPSQSPFGPVTVPQGYLWVMGDHRSASADSRAHIGDPGGGSIPIDHVIGRAFVVVWPLDRISLLDRPPAFAQAGLASGTNGPVTVSPGAASGAVPVAAIGLVLPIVGFRRFRRRR